MKLDNFILKEYKEYDLYHRSIITLLNNDYYVNKYMGNLFLLQKNINKRKEDDNLLNFYIAYYNDDIVGMICLDRQEDMYLVSYAILNNYRKYHLSALLLQEFSDKLLIDYNVNELNLSINPSNIASIKTSNLVGYKKKSLTRYSICQ